MILIRKLTVCATLVRLPDDYGVCRMRNIKMSTHPSNLDYHQMLGFSVSIYNPVSLKSVDSILVDKDSYCSSTQPTCLFISSYRCEHESYNPVNPKIQKILILTIYYETS